MIVETRLFDIPYFEYRVINRIVHEHLNALGDTLRAVVAFGPLIISGSTHDIDLLEVIENWKGPSRLQAESSADLPMLGKLYLNFISLQDFQSAAMQLPLASLEVSLEVQELLSHVLDGYEVIYEEPIGFARDTLLQVATRQKQRKGGALLPNPLMLPVAGA